MSLNKDKAYRLWVLLDQTRMAVYNARAKELSQYGISPREAATLHAIHSIGAKTTSAKISRWSYRKSHTVAGILKRMLNKGLISRKINQDFKNQVIIGLTEEGKKVYQDSTKRESIARIFGDISDEDYEKLAALIMGIMNNALAETGDTVHRPILKNEKETPG